MGLPSKRKLILLAAVATPCLLLGGLWLTRASLGVWAVTDYLRRQGVPARISIDRLTTRGFSGSAAVGPVDDPDLTVARIEADYALFPDLRFAPRVGAVTLSGVRLKAGFDGKRLQVGTLQKLVDQALAQQEADFRLPAGRRLADDEGGLLVRDERPLREIAEKVFHGCLSYRASLNRTINGGRSGMTRSCRLQGGGWLAHGFGNVPDNSGNVLQLTRQRTGPPPDHADGAARLRAGKARQRHRGRAGFDGSGHFGDEGDPDPRADHLHKCGQRASLQHLARQA